MLSCSMILVVVLNVIIIIASLTNIIIVQTMLINSDDDNPCKDGTTDSMIWIGTFASIGGIIGILGTCCRSKGLQYIYLWMLLISSISSVVFFTFIWVMMPKDDDYRVFMKTKDGYWLDAYKPTLQKALVNDKDWYDVTNCFRMKQVCEAYKFKPMVDKLNYIQTGCCKPPLRCGMVPANATFWEPPSTGLISDDNGCQKWAAYGGSGCFECDECKAGYIANYQYDWGKSSPYKLVSMVFIVVASVVAYYAIKIEPDEEAADDNDISYKGSMVLHHRTAL